MTGKELGQQPVHPIPDSMMGHRAIGLTKREAFAKAALQGMLAAPGEWPEGSMSRETRGAKLAMAYADALLDELAKERP